MRTGGVDTTSPWPNPFLSSNQRTNEPESMPPDSKAGFQCDQACRGNSATGPSPSVWLRLPPTRHRNPSPWRLDLTSRTPKAPQTPHHTRPQHPPITPTHHTQHTPHPHHHTRPPPHTHTPHTRPTTPAPTEPTHRTRPTAPAPPHPPHDRPPRRRTRPPARRQARRAARRLRWCCWRRAPAAGRAPRPDMSASPRLGAGKRRRQSISDGATATAITAIIARAKGLRAMPTRRKRFGGPRACCASSHHIVWSLRLPAHAALWSPRPHQLQRCRKALLPTGPPHNLPRLECAPHATPAPSPTHLGA